MLSSLPSFLRVGPLAASAQEESEWACGLSRTQRFQIFLVLLIGSGVLFSMSLFVFLPMLILAPSKFATSVTFASLMFMSAFAILRGPKTTLMGLLQRERLPFTLAYVSSLVLTLYSTLIAHAYLLTVISVCAQALALAWYGASFVPGGVSGMGWMTRMMVSVFTQRQWG